ncbi:PTS mannose/fructose/sorbose/N-acetylgalactosamine transporter subunit IIC [Lacticaseibacillus suihuaensis]
MTTLVFALIIAALCWLTSSAIPMWSRWAFYFGAPLVAGLIDGLLLGELTYGLQVGATIQAAYIGLLAIGGSLPNEMAIAGYLGVAMTMLSHSDPATGLAIATPLGLLGVLCLNAKMALNPIWVHKADSYAAAGDIRGLRRMNLLASQIVPFITYFIPAFLCVYFGGHYFTAFMAALPAQITAVLTLIGKLMPALGLAMLMQALAKRTTLPFLLVGFVLAAYLKLNITAVAIIGTGCALLHYYYMPMGGKQHD